MNSQDHSGAGGLGAAGTSAITPFDPHPEAGPPADPLLAHIVDHASACIAVLVGPELRYRLVNRAYQALAPKTPMLGKTFAEVFPEGGADSLKRIQRMLETGRPWEVQRWRAPVPDRPGAARRGKITRLPSLPGEPPSVLVEMEDLTEKVRADELLGDSEQAVPSFIWIARGTLVEQELRRAMEERFRGVSQQAAAGIARVGLDNRFLEVDERLARILGYSPAELLSRTSQEVTWSMSNKPGQPRCYVAVVEDSAQRKVAEEALQIQNAVLSGIARIFREALTCLSEEQLGKVCLQVVAEVTQSSMGFVGELNLQTDRLESIAISDTGWEQCRKQDPTGCSGKVASMFPIRGLYGKVLREGKGYFTNVAAAHPASVGTPPGHPPIQSFLGVPLMRGGQIWGMFAVANRPGGYGSAQLEAAEALAPSIVQAIGSKRADAELRMANLRLAEADRRKNYFMAVLSHELRNPLAPIANSLYILDHAPAAGDQARRAQAVITRQVGQLTRLVDDLLDVTRISTHKVPLHRQSLELNELVRRTLDDYRAQFESCGVAVQFAPADAPLVVHGDPNRLAQIIGNLLLNAAKFTACGGQAVVSLQADCPAQQAIVRVRDTGVGMTPEVISRLFQPFMQADETLDRSKGGLGLGLALVKGLVDLHGGEITAHSEGVGRGAEFVLRLPLELAQLEVAPGPARVAPPGRRILIIEDNLDAAESLRDLLEMEGHEVALSHRGLEGLQRARAFRPDLVLCDIGLPEMDGYQVARAFRADEALRPISLVALSGYALSEDLKRAAEAGFDAHLAKPPSLEAIARVLTEYAPGRR